MDELLQQFLIEAPELVAQASADLEQLAKNAADRARIDSAFRAIHTLKGSVAIFDMAPAGRALHAAEDLLERVRAGSQPLDSEAIAALVAVLDETDRWVDSMEQTGKLPRAADAVADRLIAAFADDDSSSSPGVQTEWLDSLRVRERWAIDSAETDLVAFRYGPDPDCFFRGEDPLAIVGAVPDLVAFAILPNEPWPALDEFEPFRCAVTLEGLSSASLHDVRSALPLVADQLATTVIPVGEGVQDDPFARSGTQRALRVDPARIDALADGIGELIVVSHTLSHVAEEADRVDPQLGARVHAAQAELERAVGAMRRSVMAVRMVSLASSLRRLPRTVREIAAGLGKSVRFEMRGETTEVDKGIADAIYEPLLHLVRNALDHGVELPEVRKAAGKPELATLKLDIRRDAESVVIALSDDGAGIDPVRIRDVAVEREVLERDAADAMDDAHAVRLIFAPGFSTASEVSAVSGRGVGLDAVQTAVQELGGTIEIASTVGSGTAFILRLPLNAIMTRLLIVASGDDRYAVPLDRIIETVSVPSDRILAIGTGKACVLRDRTLPVLELASMLGGERNPSPLTKLLVTEAATEPVGIVVDGFGQRIDGIVRPRSGLLSGVPGVAGTTLLGDGGLLLVLDLAELVG